jgi:hypothetical protein
VREFELLPSIIAALSAFVLGGLWYSPWLFGKAWQREAGLSDERIAEANKPLIFGLAFVLNLIAAIAFSMVITPEASFFMAFHSGVGIGLFWIATSLGISYLFEQRSLKHWAINAGYFCVMFTLYGMVFGLM